MHRIKALLAVLLPASLLAFSAPAAAQAQTPDPQKSIAVQALDDQAMVEPDQKRYASACRKLEEATNWEVLVGPRECSLLPKYLQEVWK